MASDRIVFCKYDCDSFSNFCNNTPDLNFDQRLSEQEIEQAYPKPELLFAAIKRDRHLTTFLMKNMPFRTWPRQCPNSKDTNFCVTPENVKMYLEGEFLAHYLPSTHLTVVAQSAMIGGLTNVMVSSPYLLFLAIDTMREPIPLQLAVATIALVTLAGLAEGALIGEYIHYKSQKYYSTYPRTHIDSQAQAPSVIGLLIAVGAIASSSYYITARLAQFPLLIALGFFSFTFGILIGGNGFVGLAKKCTAYYSSPSLHYYLNL